MKSTETELRQGHAVLDLPSRNFKAMKIARLLGVTPDGSSKRMLEVGCGSGGISHWFGAAGAMGWEVEAVDVEDVRLAKEGFGFRIVEGTQLPFQSESFDVVISNHVIEHVGNAKAQVDHLREVRRVLRPDGIAYLAVPSRWMVVEPHYRLPLLSWVPPRIANLYVRLTRKGSHYDCLPFTVGRIEREFSRAGLSYVQLHGEALRLTYELERPTAASYRWLFKWVPGFAYKATRRLFPTLIYLLRRAPADSR